MGFDGITGYTNHGAGASLSIADNMTIQAFVNCKKAFANDVVWRTQGAPPYTGYLFTAGGPVAGLGVQAMRQALWTGSVTGWRYSNTDLVLGKTHNVAVVISGATNATFYRDGVADGAVVVDALVAVPGLSLYVGNNSIASQLMRGGIYSVVIYNRVLTLAEINYNMAHPNNPIRQNCVLNLTQESLFGGQWKDLSGSANHGTLSATGVGPIPSNNLAGRNVTI